jgi:hypothetical protein
LPTGSLVELQMHDQQFLDDVWLTVASAPLSAGHDAVTRVPYAGWYRLRVSVAGGDRGRHWYCATTKPR